MATYISPFKQPYKPPLSRAGAGAIAAYAADQCD